ncbi:unnamed protein product, partial [Musa hybrid cultivar]
WRLVPDTPEPLRKTRDGAAWCRPERHRVAPTRTMSDTLDARLQNTSQPSEELTTIKGPSTTDHPRADIKANPLTNEGGSNTKLSIIPLHSN